MAKAILVIDMPDSCFHCEFCHERSYDSRQRVEGEKICGIENMEVDDYSARYYDGILVKPDWCPLKKTPEKDENCYFPDEYLDGRAAGWNACIREICD